MKFKIITLTLFLIPSFGYAHVSSKLEVHHIQKNEPVYCQEVHLKTQNSLSQKTQRSELNCNKEDEYSKKQFDETQAPRDNLADRKSKI